MKYYKILLLGLVIGSLAIPVQESCAAGKKKKKETADSVKTAPKATAYDKLFKGKKGVVHKKGVMTVHKVEDKIYLEVPVGIFGRDLLVDTHIDRTSDVGLLAPGQKAAPQPTASDRPDRLAGIIPQAGLQRLCKRRRRQCRKRTACFTDRPHRQNVPHRRRQQRQHGGRVQRHHLFPGEATTISSTCEAFPWERVFSFMKTHISSTGRRSTAVEAFNNSIAVSSEVGHPADTGVPNGHPG